MKNLFGRLFRGLKAPIWYGFAALLVIWGSLALYYSNLPWPWGRTVLATAFAAFSIWILLLSRARHRKASFGIAFLAVALWWILIPPSHHRNWRPEVAVMPRATVDGDRVRITGVRDFEYRSRNDFTARYEEREIELSHLIG
jgi:hypothetical protein